MTTPEARMLMQADVRGLQLEDEPELGSVVVTRSGGNGQWVDGWRRHSSGWMTAEYISSGRATIYTWEQVSQVNGRIVVAVFRPGRTEADR